MRFKKLICLGLTVLLSCSSLSLEIVYAQEALEEESILKNTESGSTSEQPERESLQQLEEESIQPPEEETEEIQKKDHNETPNAKTEEIQKEEPEAYRNNLKVPAEDFPVEADAEKTVFHLASEETTATQSESQTAWKYTVVNSDNPLFNTCIQITGYEDHGETELVIPSKIVFMVWLLLIYMERCKCLFMGIPGVSSFYPIPLKTVKSQKNGVKNGVRFWDVCQIIKGYNFAGFQKMQLIFRYRNVIL